MRKGPLYTGGQWKTCLVTLLVSENCHYNGGQCSALYFGDRGKNALLQIAIMIIGVLTYLANQKSTGPILLVLQSGIVAEHHQARGWSVNA